MKHLKAFLLALLGFTQTGLAELKWTPEIRMGELFPSYIIATATMKNPEKGAANQLGDWNGQLGIKISTTETNALVRVVVSSTKLVKSSKIDVRLRQANSTYTVFPVVEYDYDALYAAREPFPETVTIQIAHFKDGPENKPAVSSRKVVVQVRSINDCPRVLIDKENNRVTDLSWMFGAYVNENHPVVEEILQEALKTKIVNSFVGYQRDEATVVLQVFAIWNVFQSRGIKYSSIVRPSGESERVRSQHVRFVGESLKYQQANCVDGSVLFASVLRKIGLDADLVLVPGHCFLEVWLWPKPKPGLLPKKLPNSADPTKPVKSAPLPLFLETTMLSSTSKESYLFKADSPLFAVNKVKAIYPASFNTFVAATNAGRKKFLDVTAETRSENGQTSLSRGVHFIAIDYCRKRGIQPLKDDYKAPASGKSGGN